MANNTVLLPGSGGDTLQTVDHSGVKTPVSHLADGTTQTQMLAISAGGAAKVDGSGVTQPVSAASLPLPTGAALETGGNLATIAGAALAQETTTAGTKGVTAFGAVTTGKPTYTTAKSDALSLDTSGLLRVSLADTPANTNKFLVTPDSVALPLHQSTNVDQLNGTAPDTNSGVKSAGTLRVVLATDQPALTNKLLVTPDLPALAATSTKQSDGTQKSQIVDGSGNVIASTSNALNVAVVSGSTGNAAASATGSAVPSQGDYEAINIGGTLRGRTGVNPTGTVYAAQNDIASIAGTTADSNSGNKSAGTLRVVLATDQPALTNKLLVTPDSVALPANQSVNLNQVGGTNIVTGGVAGTQAVGGNVATNVAIGTNPINLGAQAVSSENAAVTATRMAQLVTDLVGKLIVLPYANPENFVSGVTAAMTGTTDTSLIAAPAAGLRNYITQLMVTNSHATVGTFVTIKDGSGGTILYEGYAAAAGGGFCISFPTPLRQPTTATAIYCADVTTGANVIVSASGYKGA